MENPGFTIFIIAAIIAFVYGSFWLSRQTSLLRSLMKTIPVALLAGAAWMMDSPVLLIIALGLSAMGDAFLSRQGEGFFLAGLSAFLLAHIAFSALFLTEPTSFQPTYGSNIAVWIGTIILISAVLVSLWPHLGPMKIPVFFYALTIGAMNITAWTSGQNNMLLAGVGLFVFSDIVLAHELFVLQNKAVKQRASLVVWFAYFTGQALIAGSFLLG